MAEGSEPVWWRDGVLYQIYPRSFADSNGDGVGDLRGIIERLDHLAVARRRRRSGSSPITVSPNDDWGYDVADYCDVQPELGTLADVDELVAEAGAPRHPRAARPRSQPHERSAPVVRRRRCSSRDAAHRDWYVWADPKPDGSPPNNWVSGFGGPAWTLDEATGQYYLHNFLSSQPDLNWWNDEVRDEFDASCGSGSTAASPASASTSCHMIVKDRELRDNPPATRRRPLGRCRCAASGRSTTRNRPEVHDVLRRWRALADAYDPPPHARRRDATCSSPTRSSRSTATTTSCNLAFNFLFLARAVRGRRRCATIVEDDRGAAAAGAWPVWTGRNHDMPPLRDALGRRRPAQGRAPRW